MGAILNIIDWLSVVSGILGVLSFVFALWVWMRSDMRIRELAGTLQSVYEISESIIWETNNLTAEDTETRLRQAERAIGLASSIHTLASRYASSVSEYGTTEIGALVKRGIIITLPMMRNIEISPTIKEVWLVTPDLRPDISDAATGSMVGRNLKDGKRYVYFAPANLPNLSDLILRLEVNVGARSLKSRQRSLMTVVKLDASDFPVSASDGNLIYFFKTDSQSSRGEAFREIVFTQLSQRGAFWQLCGDAEAESVYNSLRLKLTVPDPQANP
jgi:hypothetical protein